jgi:hypothetical protein
VKKEVIMTRRLPLKKVKRVKNNEISYISLFLICSK